MTDTALPPATVVARAAPSNLRVRLVRLVFLAGIVLVMMWFAGKAGDLAWRTFPETLRQVDAGGFPYVVPWLVAGLLGFAVTPAAVRVPWRWRSMPGWKTGAVVWTLVLGGTVFPALTAMVQNGIRVHQLGLGLAAAAIGWPVVEEWLFRGMLWRELCPGDGSDRWISVSVAVIVTSVSFGLWHLPRSPSSVWGAAIYGALMALLRWRTGGILACVVVHGVANALGYVARW
jgi:membrane protease YdiL (CAAX protease family)